MFESERTPMWMSAVEKSREKLSSIVEMVRSIGTTWGEDVTVSYEYGKTDKVAKFDAVVTIGSRASIAVKVVVEGEWRKMGRRLEMELRAATGAKKVDYYLVALGDKAILYTETLLLGYEATQEKVDAVPLSKAIDKLECELFSVSAGGVDESDLKNLVKGDLENCRDLSSETIEAIKRVEIRKKDYKNGGSYYYLDDNSEEELIMALLGGQDIKRVSKYTSLDSFKRMVDERKLSLCSIVGMNDKSECSYASEYIWGREDNLNGLEYINESNSCFVMSCVEADRNDDLTMWRLYGDDGKGVCMTLNRTEWDAKKYGLKNVFAKVKYARENGVHPELDYIKNLLSGSAKNGCRMRFQHIDIWKHFFKPYEYATENEIRLFIRKSNDNEELENKIKWIKTNNDGIICPLISFDFTDDKKDQFQFELESVILGPKCPESDINVVQLKRYIESQKLNVSPKFEVKKSNIKTYR